MGDDGLSEAAPPKTPSKGAVKRPRFDGVEDRVAAHSVSSSAKNHEVPNRQHSFGKQKLPIHVAAGNCDPRYSLVSTVSGVTRISDGVKIEQAEPIDPTPAK